MATQFSVMTWNVENLFPPGSFVSPSSRNPVTEEQFDAKSCTSGRAGGLICEPLKAVWPAYAGIVYSNIFSCSSLLSSFSCSLMYSRICASSRPTVDT
jgi:hypothetical protein